MVVHCIGCVGVPQDIANILADEPRLAVNDHHAVSGPVARLYGVLHLTASTQARSRRVGHRGESSASLTTPETSGVRIFAKTTDGVGAALKLRKHLDGRLTSQARTIRRQRQASSSVAVLAVLHSSEPPLLL